MKSFMFLHPAILALFLLGMLPVASAYNDLVFFTGDSDNCDYHDAVSSHQPNTNYIPTAT